MARAGCRAGGYRVSNAISATPTFDEAHYKALDNTFLLLRPSGRAPGHLFPAVMASNKRLALSRDQRSVLEAVYAVEKLPDAALRERLSKYLDLDT